MLKLPPNCHAILYETAQIIHVAIQFVYHAVPTSQRSIQNHGRPSRKSVIGIERF
jgi:hypothetical protein